ncbi:hypothetical protein [Micrococcus terreus]|uniref:hypothetical protein n=1 Tax=Micrococcus terreus TaxID=574650 RepID=UPI00254D1827|nr:hypothetical protein [Micrococcus terreus]MDK7700784.1 hypothetical protein [Micrococcus terreus]WOO96944.1 hypothetical protein R3I42_10490 [Micrococcus terreus]
MSHSHAPSPARLPLLTVGLAVTALALSACGAGAAGSGASPSATAAGPSASTSPATSPSPRSTERTEVASVTPRVVLSHDGGLTTLDAETGEVVHEQEREGFLRLNNAGDGQHVMVSGGDEFLVYDAGIDAQVHGDHHHFYSSEPGLTGVTFPAPAAGHVVTHNGLTTLFTDGTGAIQTFTSEHLRSGMPRAVETSTEDAHHGVALELTDGSLLTTQGTEEGRNTVQVLDRESGKVLAETTDCPGVHGETAAAPHGEGADRSDVVVLGCENGPVVYRDGQFHKVPVETEYQRSGNLAGTEASSIVLGDYKVDADAEQERPTEIALIDSVQDTLTTVDLGSSYWFRSLARGPEGESLVLTYDGELNILDESGKILHEVKAIEPWEEKDEWQQPGPILKSADCLAYITDAEQQKLVIVDIEKGTVERTLDLPVAPVEMVVITGHAETSTEHADHSDHEGHEDEGHEGHDH